MKMAWCGDDNPKHRMGMSFRVSLGGAVVLWCRGPMVARARIRSKELKQAHKAGSGHPHPLRQTASAVRAPVTRAPSSVSLLPASAAGGRCRSIARGKVTKTKQKWQNSTQPPLPGPLTRPVTLARGSSQACCPLAVRRSRPWFDLSCLLLPRSQKKTRTPSTARHKISDKERKIFTAAVASRSPQRYHTRVDRVTVQIGSDRSPDRLRRGGGRSRKVLTHPTEVLYCMENRITVLYIEGFSPGEVRGVGR